MRTNLLNNLSKGMNFSLTRMCERLREMWAAMSNHAIITQLSRNNHPIAHRCIRYATALLVVLMVGYGQMWADTDVFTATVQASSEVKVASISSYTDFTAAQATFTGGSMQYKQTNSTAKAILESSIGPSGDKRKCFRIETNDCSFKVVLNSALQNGDVISADLYNNNVDIWFSTSTTRPGSAPSTKISASGGTSSAWNARTYTVTTGDGICGQTTFYIYRNSNTTNFNFAITRPDPPTDWYVKGGWNSWGTTDNLKGSGTEISAKVNITSKGTYEFKVWNNSGGDGTWYGNGGNIGCNVSGWVFSTSDGNCKFFASETGNYTFTFNTSTKALSVTYPTAQGKYYYKNTSSWGTVAVYRFVTADNTKNNTWPGTQVVETETICGDTYYFTYADPSTTIIFNNNNGGSQTGDMNASGNAGKYVAGTGDSWTGFTYNVTYNANGGTGSVPTDATNYSSGASVPVKDNSGLTKSGYYFAGWNTKSDGSGTTYVLGETFSITSCTTLYAKWNAISCPDGSETATVFSLTSPTGTVSVTAGTSKTITSSIATVSKGMATMVNGAGSNSNMINSNKFSLAYNACVLRLNLGCALAAGDVISFADANNPFMVSKTNSTSPGTNNFVVQPSKTENCTIPAGSNLIGLKEVYIVRPSATGTTCTGITITRPAGCAAPTALTGSSVTADGVTLTVTDANNTDDYEFYVSTSSTAPLAGATATHTVTDSKSKAITGLAFSTTYYAWARSKCGESNKSDWVALIGSTFTTLNTAPASAAVNPSNGWIYVPGEEIELTASATAATINSSTTYTWYKGSTLEAAKAAGAIQSAATAASGGATYTIDECEGADAGKYWCEISNGVGYVSSASYDIKVYYFNLFDNSHSAIDNYVFTSIDRTNNKISVTLELENTNYTYYFKVSDGISTWYGTPSGNDGACITGSTPYLDALQTGAGNNIGLTSSFADNYTIDFYYNSRNVVVTYPIHNQDEDVTVYFDNHLTEMDNIYLRIGHDANNKATSAFTLVPGTANLYVGATTSFDNFHAWSIADNTGKTGSYTIYQPWDGEWDGTGNTGQMSKQTNYQHSVVTETISIIPTSENNEEYDCQYYNVEKVNGMKADRVTISSYSNGTITVNYVDTEGDDASFTSGYEDLAHTCVLTSITAVPATGYTIDDALTINEASYAANYVVTGATTVAASFKPATYSVTLNTNSGTINSGDVDEYTYLTGATLPTDVTRSGYRFMGWYASSDFSTDRVYTIGTSEYGNKEYWAKWAQLYAITDADPDNGSLAITDGSSAITEAIEGETVYIVATPSTGYNFDAWNIYKTGTPATTVSPAAATASTSFTMPAYAVTVDATFAEVTYSLSYDIGGDATGAASGGTSAGSYAEGTTITTPAKGTLANEGYTFRGWTDGTTFYTAGQSFTMPASDVELAAVWDDGASGSTKYYYGQVKIVADTLQKNLSSASICFFTNTSGVIASSTDLSFTANPNTGGIYYYSNDLSDTELSKSSNWKSGSEDGRYIRGLKFANGTDYTLELGTNVASSIKFYGWCGSASKTMTVGGQSFTSNSTKNTFETNNFTKSGGFTGDVTISQDADFYGILVISIGAEATHFKVSFDDQKGFAGSSALPADIVGVPSGKKILPPSDPTASGYTFSGWYTDAACTSAVNWNTMTITENRTLYAKWCTVAHDITWVVNGETYTTGDPTTSTTDCDGIETMPTAPSALTCSDSFRGWSETNIYGEAVDTPPADLFVAAANAPTINEDKTFYAVFATQDDPDDARTAEQMKEYSFTSLFTSKAWADAGSLWTSGKDGTNLTTGRGVKVETGATGAYATTASSYKGVKEVIVTYSTNASAGAGAITIEVGSTAMSGSADVTKTGGTTDRTITYKPASAHFLDGKVKITVTCTTNAIYIKSVQVIYSGYHEYRCICPSLSVTPKLVTASTPIFITSAASKTVRSQDSLVIVGSGLKKNATLSISSPASEFALKSRTGADLTTSATGAIDTVAYIYYTPGEGDTDDGLDKNNSFTITDGTNTETVSTALIGRHLPANFVIAAKSGDKWYALPADKSNNTQDPVEIEVDDDDDPTLVTTTEANVYSWYGQTSTVINGGNGHTTRLEMHGIAPTGGSGHAPLFGSSGTGTSLGQSGPTTLGGSAGSDYWWIFTQTNTSVSATTDVKYNMTVANSNTKHVRINSNKWGLYTSGVDEIRLIPWSCATPAAPTIGGTQTYTTGETITLTASHDGSNHDAYTTYTWYKGATWDAASAADPVQAAATGSSGYTLTIASCDADDAGTYWCEASNGSCTAHNATGYAVDVPLGSHTLTWAPNVNTGESSIGTASKNSTTSLISNSTDMSNIGNYGSLTITSSAKDKLTSKIGTPASYDADKYMYVTFDVPSGYQFTPTNISVKVQPVATNKDVKLILSDAGNSITKTQTDVTEGTITTITETNTGGTAFTGTVTLKIYCYGATDDYRLGSPITISGDIEEFSGYVLTWNTNGGSELECTGTCTEGVMDAGDDIVAPTDPTMSNYTFDGWKTNNDGTGTAAPATMPSSSVTYYASWKQTVTLNTGIAGSGADKTPYVYLNGTALSSSAVHSAAGYTLNGYYTATSAGTKVLNADGSFAGTAVTDYITSSKWSRTGAAPTLYAQWTENLYDVTYNKNDEDATGSTSAQNDVHYVTLQENGFALADHLFVEWNTKSDGSGIGYAQGEELELTGDLVLYAIWSDDYSVSWGNVQIDGAGATVKPNLGGGNYTITATISTWDGDTKNIELGDVTEGVTASITGTTSTTVTITFAVGADVEGDAISLSINVPAHGDFGAKTSTEDIDLENCGNSGSYKSDVLFSQNFGSATEVAYAANTARAYTVSSADNNIVGNTPASQFTSITCNAKGSTGIGINSSTGGNSENWSGKFGAYANNSSYYWSICKTSNFASTAPTAVKITFDALLAVVDNGTSKAAVNFLVGSGFSDGITSTLPAASKIYTGFGLQTGSTSSKNHTVIKVGSTTALSSSEVVPYNTMNSFTWVINNSESSITYTAPNSTSETVAAGTWDLWIGTSKVVNDKARASSGSSTFSGTSIQNMYIGSSTGNKHEFHLDNVVVTDISPIPSDLISSTLTWTPALNTDGDWDGTNSRLNKETGDADFTFTVTSSTNSAGAITYASSNTSVATVNSTTGKVHIAGAAGNATITATMAESGCYEEATATYNIAVVDNCDDVPGTIETTDLGCSGTQMTVSGHTGEGAGATYQWYKDGASIGGATSATYTATAAGEYYVVVTNTGDGHCAMTSTNTIVVEALSGKQATRLQTEWYVKNGRRTPDIALVQTGNAKKFIVKNGETVLWDSSDGDKRTGFGGCGFYLGDDEIIYLKGTQNDGSAPSGLTGSTDVTLTIKTVYCDDAEKDNSVAIHCQAATSYKEVAFVVDGTEGGNWNAVTSGHADGTALYEYLDTIGTAASARKFQLTERNIYKTVDDSVLREHYSQFDAILITDNPSTDKMSGKKSYVDAFGTMIDIRPILTMEAYVSKLSNWKAKGINGSPTSPNPRQYGMKLECKNHEIFAGLNELSSNIKTQTVDFVTYWTVLMVDSTKSPYTGVAYNVDTKGNEKPALQGFSASDVSGLMLLGQISNGTLFAGVERQDEPAARLLLLGVNAKALPNALTPEGKRVIANALSYLCKTNMEDVDDCSTYFTGATNTDWNTASNWSKGTVPNSPMLKVRILKPCVLPTSTKVRISHLDIVVGGTSKEINTTPNGSLTIPASSAVVVAGTVNRVKAPYYGLDDLMPTEAEDLKVEANSTNTGALILDNEKGDTKATVEMYSPSYWETVAGKKKKYWSYVGVPIQEVDIPNYFYLGFTYLYDETSGWTKMGDGSELHPFEGIGLSMQSGHKETFYGTLASTATKEITLTMTDGKGGGENLIGNSWTAPIQIANFDADDFGDATATVYVYNTGKDASAEGSYGDESSTTPGQWVSVPVETAKEGGYTGLKVIPAMNAFQVNTTTETTLTLDYDKLVRKGASTNDLNDPMRAPRRQAAGTELEAMMRVRVSGTKTHTDVWLQQDSRFTDAFDNGWEAKYAECDNRSAQFYAQSEIGNMAFLALPDLEGTVLGFAPSRDGNEYTFTFHYVGEETFYLNDLKLVRSALISEEGSYTFTYEEGDTNRFYISRQAIDAPAVTTGVDPIHTTPKAQKILYQDKLYILYNGRVFDATGKVVK